MAEAKTTGGAALLERAYRVLDLEDGMLIDAADSPRSGADGSAWRQHGDWLLLAHRVGAEKVFFVGDDPVVLFAALRAGSSEADVVEAYCRAWSLARPRCLFLAV